ncbi:MAG: DUF4349 domain-containing protein [Thermoanaerobaculia bacterium]|nr:DUF4349 domain-containing protein [Thermoanaerobaculia bacterium]
MTNRQLTYPLALVLFVAAVVFSCKNASAPESAGRSAEPPAPTAAEEAPLAGAQDAKGIAGIPDLQPAFHSGATTITRWDTLKKLVRRAEVRFRTPDVLQTTLAIEDIVRQNGGFMLDDNLTQTLQEQHLTAISRDSSLETSILHIENHLLFRVPFAHLDTTLRAIGRWAELLDYRRIHAEDKTLAWLEEQLAELRNRQYQARIESAAAQPGSKLDAVTGAIDKSLAGRAAADAARLEQLRFEDAVQLSTVQLDLYQRPVVRREMVANLKQVDSWRPGFGSRLGEAFSDSWQFLQDTVLFLIRVWPLLLIGALAVWFIWRRKKRGQSRTIPETR